METIHHSQWQPHDWLAQLESHCHEYYRVLKECQYFPDKMLTDVVIPIGSWGWDGKFIFNTFLHATSQEGTNSFKWNSTVQNLPPGNFISLERLTLIMEEETNSWYHIQAYFVTNSYLPSIPLSWKSLILLQKTYIIPFPFPIKVTFNPEF